MVLLPMSTMESDVTQGLMCLFIWDRPQGSSVESTHFHFPSMMTFKFITNKKRITIIGAYLPPFILEHLLDFEEALPRFRYQDAIVLGDLSSRIVQDHNPRNQQVIYLLM